MQKMLLVLEHNGEAVADSSLRLCSSANQCSGSTNLETAALFFGSCLEDALKPLGRYSISKVYLARGSYSPAQKAATVLELVDSLQSSLILLPDTLQGREIAPLLAVKLEAGLLAHCVYIRFRDGQMEAVCNVYNGQYQQVCEFVDSPNVVIMTDIDHGAVEPAGAAEAEIVAREGVCAAGPALKVLETFSVPAGEADIDEADIVVGVGRGVAGREDLKLVEDLASTLGAPLGGTRPVVDDGLIPFTRQIGQTGRVIAPEYYLAVGVSGARQHISGVQKGKIIAINKDPRAPIFRLADLGVVGNYKAIVPLLIRELQETGKGGRY